MAREIPPEVLAVILAQRDELEALVPVHRAALVAAAQSIQEELWTQLKGLAPNSLASQMVAQRRVEIGAIIDNLGRDYGIRVGDAIEDAARIAAEIGRDGLIDQLVAWAPEGAPAIRRVGTVAKAAGVLDEGLLEYHRASKATYGMEAIQKMRGAMSRSALAGESIVEAFPTIAEAAEIPEWRAERIVRTETSYAANRSELKQLDGMYTPEAAKEVFVKELVTSFDQRTGEDSIFVDGQIRKLDQNFEDNEGRSYPHPPNRPNDREVMVIVPAQDDAYDAIVAKLDGLTDAEQEQFLADELSAAQRRLSGRP